MMTAPINAYDEIVCVGGPSHGKSYSGYHNPTINVEYFPSEWEDIASRYDNSLIKTRVYSLTYERFLVEVKLPGLRLEGWVWKWDKLNDVDCVKAAMGLILSSTILVASEKAVTT